MPKPEHKITRRHNNNDSIESLRKSVQEYQRNGAEIVGALDKLGNKVIDEREKRQRPIQGIDDPRQNDLLRDLGLNTINLDNYRKPRRGFFPRISSGLITSALTLTLLGGSIRFGYDYFSHQTGYINQELTLAESEKDTINYNPSALINYARQYSNISNAKDFEPGSRTTLETNTGFNFMLFLPDESGKLIPFAFVQPSQDIGGSVQNGDGYEHLFIDFNPSALLSNRNNDPAFRRLNEKAQKEIEENKDYNSSTGRNTDTALLTTIQFDASRNSYTFAGANPNNAFSIFSIRGISNPNSDPITGLLISLRHK